LTIKYPFNKQTIRKQKCIFSATATKVQIRERKIESELQYSLLNSGMSDLSESQSQNDRVANTASDIQVDTPS